MPRAGSTRVELMLYGGSLVAVAVAVVGFHTAAALVGGEVEGFHTAAALVEVGVEDFHTQAAHAGAEE